MQIVGRSTFPNQKRGKGRRPERSVKFPSSPSVVVIPVCQVEDVSDFDGIHVAGSNIDAVILEEALTSRTSRFIALMDRNQGICKSPALVNSLKE